MIISKITFIISEVLKDKDLNVKFVVEEPKNPTFGDYATNVAMQLVKVLKRNPMEIAEEIADELRKNSFFSSVELAKPGFINFRLSSVAIVSIASELESVTQPFPRKGEKYLSEYGSINPTGPLHIGHGRNVIVGDVLSSLMDKIGYDVTREYYINDAGVQIENLAKSLNARFLELKGETIEFPEDGYQGSYIVNMAKDFLQEHKDANFEKDKEIFKAFSTNWCLGNIKNALSKMNIVFDSWVSESSIHEKYSLVDLLKELKAKGLAYDLEGATWCKTTEFGDDKDRAVLKGDGAFTYYGSDLLYSKNKIDRGYSKAAVVLGADHHGYLERFWASFELNSFNRKDVPILLMQMVQFFRGTELVKMSKRSGEFYTLEELVDEIGSDACRVFFISRKNETPMDFDIELAKSQSSDNPVYYMQYAHARICSLFARENYTKDVDLSLLVEQEEKDLVKKIGSYQAMLEHTSRDLELHRLVTYGVELSSIFHTFYNKCRMIDAEDDLKKSRLYLTYLVQMTLQDLFKILKIDAPESM